MDSTSERTGRLAAISQVALGAALAGAGIAHLTVAREEFQAQVPGWFPIEPDAVVVGSGVIEVALGAALLGSWSQPARAVSGTAAAAFFVAIFPGNIAQYVEGTDAFGLDSDAKRLARLPFQPVLVAAALWSTGAVRQWRQRLR